MVEQFQNNSKEGEVENNLKEINPKGENILKRILDLLPEYLRSRFLSAIILIPIAIFAIYASKNIFTILIIATAILMAFEWITIVKSEEENNMWKILGLIYIIIPCFSLIYIRGLEKGSDIILWLFLVVWGTDIGGMIVGLNVGGPKLAPKISPKKTWSGLAGGVLTSMFVGLITSLIFKETAMFFIIFSGIMAVIEQIGDLLESAFKRHFGVKDSGNIIPGHGGVMDRVDGLTLVAPIVALIALLTKNVF